MHPIELILALLAVAVALALLASVIRTPYPILLVIGGLLLSLQPWTPKVVLDPNVVFLLFLPPLLYAGAFQTDWDDFRAHLRPITMLAFGLVLLTTFAVAAAAHWLIGLPWALGCLLGAIVSPPDAVAAMAITKQVSLPRRLTAILEGESLINDASALVAYRMALAAIVTGTFSLGEASWEFVKVSFGGLLLGVIIGWLVTQIHPWMTRRQLADSKLTITMTLLTPYAAYLSAEHLHLSGVLAVVAAGLWVGSRCEEVFSKEVYTEAKAVWDWIDFLLNSLIFILIGFQMPQILDGLRSDYDLEKLVGYAMVISLVVIVVRFLWVYPAAYIPRMLFPHIRRREPHPPWQAIFITGWTGLRGVVSLAAAMAIPAKLPDGSDFPYRDLILFLTFWVIFVTLVGQGLTLPWIIKWLGVDRIPVHALDPVSDESQPPS